MKICENDNCNIQLINKRSDAKYCSEKCCNNQRHLNSVKDKLKSIVICINKKCNNSIAPLGNNKFCSIKCRNQESHSKKMEQELMMREFKKCNYEKCIVDISKMKKGIKYCCNEHRLLENKENANEKSKAWYENNKERGIESRKKYYNNNKTKLIEGIIISQRERRKDPKYKLQNSISCSIRRILKSNKLIKNKKTIDILGCSYDYFKEYIESKLENWMNWENYGKYNGNLDYGWDIDHIIPASSAINEDDVVRLNHYTNLQPLCSKINRDIKKDKF